jgi:hypothetical protein
MVVSLVALVTLASEVTTGHVAFTGGETPTPSTTRLPCTPHDYLMLFSPSGRNHRLPGQSVQTSGFVELYSRILPNGQPGLSAVADMNAEGEGGYTMGPLCTRPTMTQDAHATNASTTLTRRPHALTLSCSFAQRPTVVLWHNLSHGRLEPNGVALVLGKRLVVDATLVRGGKSTVRFDIRQCTVSPAQFDILCDRNSVCTRANTPAAHP